MDKRSFDELVKKGSLTELRAAYDERIALKKKIETQLADDKAEMLGERADWLDQGLSARDAQHKASSRTDFDWRRRASALLRMVDVELPRLRQRIHELSETSKVQSVDVLRGSAEEIAAALAGIAERAFIQQVFVVDGAAVVLARVTKS